MGPAANPDSWRATVRADARAMYLHRANLAVALLLAAGATAWLSYATTLHGPLKLILVLISGYIGALVVIWAFSWGVAGVFANNRRRREAIRQRASTLCQGDNHPAMNLRIFGRTPAPPTYGIWDCLDPSPLDALLVEVDRLRKENAQLRTAAAKFVRAWDLLGGRGPNKAQALKRRTESLEELRRLVERGELDWPDTEDEA